MIIVQYTSVLTDEQSKVVYRHLDTNVSKIDIQDKLDKLVETINEYIYRIEQEENIELIEIIKLYC